MTPFITSTAIATTAIIINHSSVKLRSLYFQLFWSSHWNSLPECIQDSSLSLNGLGDIFTHFCLFIIINSCDTVVLQRLCGWCTVQVYYYNYYYYHYI